MRKLSGAKEAGSRITEGKRPKMFPEVDPWGAVEHELPTGLALLGGQGTLWIHSGQSSTPGHSWGTGPYSRPVTWGSPRRQQAAVSGQSIYPALTGKQRREQVWKGPPVTVSFSSNIMGEFGDLRKTDCYLQRRLCWVQEAGGKIK